MSTYDRRPQVLSLDPKSYATEVGTTLKEIKINFSTDLDQNYITGNVRVETQSGVTVASSLAYSNRTITVTLQEQILANKTYQVVIIGDSNLDNDEVVGVRNVFNRPMAGIYQSTFTTAHEDTLPAPVVLYPSDSTTIKAIPTFEWEQVVGATRYEVQLSKSNTMIPIIWDVSLSETQRVTDGGVKPTGDLDDDRYYWRVRAVDSSDTSGDWTKLQHFYLDTLDRGPISNDDPFNDDLLDEPNELEDMIEVIDASIDRNKANLRTDMKIISFHIIGDVTEADIDISLVGESITGEDEDHDEIEGVVKVLPQSDGTTIIQYTLPLLEGETPE